MKNPYNSSGLPGPQIQKDSTETLPPNVAFSYNLTDLSTLFTEGASCRRLADEGHGERGDAVCNMATQLNKKERIGALPAVTASLNIEQRIQEEPNLDFG